MYQVMLGEGVSSPQSSRQGRDITRRALRASHPRPPAHAMIVGGRRGSASSAATPSLPRNMITARSTSPKSSPTRRGTRPLARSVCHPAANPELETSALPNRAPANEPSNHPPSCSTTLQGLAMSSRNSSRPWRFVAPDDVMRVRRREMRVCSAKHPLEFRNVNRRAGGRWPRASARSSRGEVVWSTSQVVFGT